MLRHHVRFEGVGVTELMITSGTSIRKHVAMDTHMTTQVGLLKKNNREVYLTGIQDSHLEMVHQFLNMPLYTGLRTRK